MMTILKKIVMFCVPEINKKTVTDLIKNEMYHYIEPRHKTEFMDTMWEIGQAIRKSQYIEIDYKRSKDKTIVKRKVKPVAILFSEYYFYLTAFIEDDNVRSRFTNIDDAFPTMKRHENI